MLLNREELQVLQQALERLELGFARLPDWTTHSLELEKLKSLLLEAADRLRDNYPYFHPLYAGQMLKPPHPIARLAYTLALWINPNNHALDGGKASSSMEREAVAELASMFDWKTHLGHLCSGGTIANLEALWVAGQIAPGKKVVASQQAHYTHQRLSQVLKLEFESVPCDHLGKMDIAALKQLLARGGVGTVVVTMGTTATGSVDPLEEILALRPNYHFRLHADAAYGGYFKLANNVSRQTRKNFEALSEVDSLVIDPHKHGLQPYGCGCVLFKNPEDARFYQHDSPYTYFTSEELHLGEISLECSRPGASAVALWTTQKLLPLRKGGELAAMLGRSRNAALELYERLRGDERWLVSFTPELDIVVWVARAPSVKRISELSRAIFAEASQKGLHLALANLPASFFHLDENIVHDSDIVTTLRSVLMKPEHEEWIERIWQILNAALDEQSDSD